MTEPQLTEDEQKAMDASSTLANACRRVIGNGPQADHDWSEIARSIHDIQCRILAQVAARAGLCRPLGGGFKPEDVEYHEGDRVSCESFDITWEGTVTKTSNEHGYMTVAWEGTSATTLHRDLVKLVRCPHKRREWCNDASCRPDGASEWWAHATDTPGCVYATGKRDVHA